MSLEWQNLPLLPLKCVLNHLGTDDAIAAMSVCRHWRSEMLLYEGHKELLKLRPRRMEQCLFLTRMFRKYVKKLHIYLDCSNEQLDKFMSCVLPQYFDTVDLQELVFLGSGHIHQIQSALPYVKLNRVIVESFIIKHSNSLKTLGFLCCEVGNPVDDDRFIHKQVELHSRSLAFQHSFNRADSVIYRCNSSHLMFSTIRHIILNYETVSAETLKTLSALPNFNHLTLNLVYRKRVNYKRIHWLEVNPFLAEKLQTSLNVVGVPQRKLDLIMDTILCSRMNLVSLKIMYCKTLSNFVVQRVGLLFKDTLRELIWADCPFPSAERTARYAMPSASLEEYEYEDDSLVTTCHVNPFILLCWQCHRLQTLAIHGYWLYQYDVIGFARLRGSLTRLEIPAIYDRQGRFPENWETVRVLAGDTPTPPGEHVINEINDYTNAEWVPVRWAKLHPGLLPNATPENRADYVLQETLHSLDVRPAT